MRLGGKSSDASPAIERPILATFFGVSDKNRVRGRRCRPRRWPPSPRSSRCWSTRSSPRSAPQVPAYARPLEGAFGQAVRIGVEEALKQFSASGPLDAASAARAAASTSTSGAARRARGARSRRCWRPTASARSSPGAGSRAPAWPAGLDTDTLVLLAEGDLRLHRRAVGRVRRRLRPGAGGAGGGGRPAARRPDRVAAAHAARAARRARAGGAGRGLGAAARAGGARVARGGRAAARVPPAGRAASARASRASGAPSCPTPTRPGAAAEIERAMVRRRPRAWAPPSCPRRASARTATPARRCGSPSTTGATRSSPPPSTASPCCCAATPALVAELAAERLAPLDGRDRPARARASPRRCTPGCATRATRPPPPPISTSTPRRSATASARLRELFGDDARRPRRALRAGDRPARGSCGLVEPYAQDPESGRPSHHARRRRPADLDRLLGGRARHAVRLRAAQPRQPRREPPVLRPRRRAADHRLHERGAHAGPDAHADRSRRRAPPRVLDLAGDLRADGRATRRARPSGTAASRTAGSWTRSTSPTRWGC